MKTNKTVTFLLFLVLISTRHIWGDIKMDTYQSVFRDWGLRAGAYSKELLRGDYFNIFLSSQLTESFDLDNSYGNKIVICDIFCNVNESYRVDIVKGKKSSEDVYIYDVSSKNGRILYFPEEMLVGSYHREKLSYFIKSLALSTGTSSVITERSRQVLPLSDIKDSLVFEVVTYFLGALLLTILTAKMLYSRVCKDLKYLISKKAAPTLKATETKLLRYSKYFFIASIFMAISFIGLTILISFKDTGSISIPYFANYLIEVVSFRTFKIDLEYLRTFRLFVLLYFYIFAFVLASLFFPVVLGLVSRTLNQMGKKKFKIRSGKNILLFSYAISLLVLFSANLKIIIVYITYLFLITLYISSNLAAKKTFSNYFTKKEKSVFITFFIVVLIIKFLTLTEDKILPYRRQINLIKEREKVVLLPYTREVSKGDVLRDYFVNMTTPIFINDYLIYTNKVSKIINLPLESFEESDNYILLSTDKDTFIKYLFLYPKLRDTSVSTGFTGVFYAEDFDFNFYNNYEIQLGFYCDDDTEPSEVLLRLHFTNIDLKNSVMIFPGCDHTNEVVYYKAPFIVNKGEDGLVFFDMPINYATEKIISAKIFQNGEELVTNHININNQKNIVVEKVSDENKPLKVYSPRITKEFEVQNMPSGKFNISKYINEMIDLGIIDEDFTIWSPGNDVKFLRNELK